MRQIFSRRLLAQDERGNVAIMFALSMFVLVGAVGGAVDVSRTLVTRATLQEVADYTALSLATTKANDQRDTTSFSDGALSDTQAEALADAQKRAAELGAGNVTLTAVWLNGSDLRVTATSVYSTVFLNAVPGAPAQYDISAVSIAQAFDNSQKAGQITKKDVSFEAGDYNRVYMYCYDKDKKSDESANFGRSQMTPVSDNGGTTYPDIANFKCSKGTVSFRLYNVRGARTQPSKWETGNPDNLSSTAEKCGKKATDSKPCYNWYTDTTVDSTTNTDTYNTSPYQLETILCDDPECKTPTTDANPDGTRINASGTYVPGNNNVNRIPQKALGCVPGKYMYYGWEDRPPLNTNGDGTGAPLAAGARDGGGDRDYDDIRVIIKCPEPSGIRKVRLIK